MRLATWNVENLFRPGSPGGPRTQADYDAKLDALADRLVTLDADVVALQEIGDPGALDDLVARRPPPWPRALSSAPDDRGIRVGFLARVVLRRCRDIVGFAPGLEPIQADDAVAMVQRMGRGALQVTATIEGREVVLITCHLKSKLLSFGPGRFSPRDEDERARYGAYALYRRAAEAATVRVAATAALAGEGATRDVVVLGDLNDTPEAATTQLLLGPPGSELDTPGFAVPDRGDGTRLWNLAPRIAPARAFSRINRGRRELIDHILVSRALVERVRSVDAVVAGLPSVDDEPPVPGPRPSDHAPVVAAFA